ncbi:MAG: rhamnosidase, partial [Clostridia bacterium]|nr:rhamnosidase [Clostridia bacterium]
IKQSIRSDGLIKAYVSAFYNPKTGLFCDTEKLSHSSLHSNALPLYFGIAEPEMYEDIKNFIMEKGLCCGVYMAYFVLKGLANINAYEEEFRLLINEGEHSWVNMLREGATTCFEAWGKEQKWNTSLCHPWASTPIIALCEDLNGKQFREGTISITNI